MPSAIMTHYDKLHAKRVDDLEKKYLAECQRRTPNVRPRFRMSCGPKKPPPQLQPPGQRTRAIKRKEDLKAPKPPIKKLIAKKAPEEIEYSSADEYSGEEEEEESSADETSDAAGKQGNRVKNRNN